MFMSLDSHDHPFPGHNKAKFAEPLGGYDIEVAVSDTVINSGLYQITLQKIISLTIEGEILDGVMIDTSFVNILLNATIEDYHFTKGSPC